MCGRYFRRGQKQELAERFRLAGGMGDFPLPPDYNVAPTTFQPVIRENRDTRERELVMMRWGLVPFFAKSLAEFKGFSTINARAESVSKAATYREAFRKRRCLVPADGFYEWKSLDAPEGKGKVSKQPFAFSLKNGRAFAFAGVWDAWKDKASGEWLQSFSIITTDPNEVTGQVHNRMPVMVHDADWDLWLSRDVGREEGDVPRLLAVLRPYEADAMQAQACNPLVGNVKNNGPEMLNSA